MNLLIAKFDNRELNRMLNNTVSYSYSFLDGVQMERQTFNRFLGGMAVEALGKYIDVKARAYPSKLHHVYEPGNVGNQSMRLFNFTIDASPTQIKIGGSFLPSKKAPMNDGEPFSQKASIMENGIGILISPVNSDVLAFEDEGEMVFTANSIFIEHPGGDEVAGSFGETINDFFESYFTVAVLRPLIKDLSSAEEFVNNFVAGTKSPRVAGVKAGKEYMAIKGAIE